MPNDITNCPNCGAVLNWDGSCDYCGTKVNRPMPNMTVNVVKTTKPINQVIVSRAVSEESLMYAPDAVMEYTKRDMMNDLLDYISKNLELEEDYDPRTRIHKVKARVGFVDLHNQITNERTML